MSVSVVFILYSLLLIGGCTAFIKFSFWVPFESHSVIGKLNCASKDKDNSIIFAGARFYPPISQSLSYLNIKEASPIQAAAIGPLTTGLSCILHAETGSGKTLAFLLPILKRLYTDKSSNIETGGIRAMIIAPTRELAVQIGLDVSSLLDGDQSKVHICMSDTKKGLDDVTAPIVVGTSFKLVDAIKVSSPRVLENLDYLVLDEVDRLVPPISKYASYDIKKKRSVQKNPTIELLDLIMPLKADSNRAKGIKPDPSDPYPMQVVAASATVGRPLRRELHKVVMSAVAGEPNHAYTGQFPVIRPDDSTSNDGKIRMVGIPATIKHIVLLDDGEADDLASKLSVVKEHWMRQGAAARGLLFVPKADDVKQALGILKFWGVTEAKNLQEALGLVVEDDAPKPKEDKDAQTDDKDAQTDDTPEIDKIPLPIRKKLSTEDYLDLARESRIGAFSGSTGTGDASEDRERESAGGEAGRDLFVVPVSGTRGLHIQGIDCVYVLKTPAVMDEYLHMAGRTGRLGSEGKGEKEEEEKGKGEKEEEEKGKGEKEGKGKGEKEGKGKGKELGKGNKEEKGGNKPVGHVISVVSMDELKRLQSWQTPLGIEFDIQIAR